MSNGLGTVESWLIVGAVVGACVAFGLWVNRYLERHFPDEGDA